MLISDVLDRIILNSRWLSKVNKSEKLLALEFDTKSVKEDLFVLFSAQLEMVLGGFPWH